MPILQAIIKSDHLSTSKPCNAIILKNDNCKKKDISSSLNDVYNQDVSVDAQNIGVFSGKRFIIVPKDNLNSVQSATTLKPNTFKDKSSIIEDFDNLFFREENTKCEYKIFNDSINSLHKSNKTVAKEIILNKLNDKSLKKNNQILPTNILSTNKNLRIINDIKSNTLNTTSSKFMKISNSTIYHQENFEYETSFEVLR